MHIGLLEDDPDWAARVDGALADAGWRCTHLADAETFRRQVLAGMFDALVVDVQLDGQGTRGTDVIAALRQAGCGIPALILTQFPAIHRAATSLDRGADDYLAKPFDANELRARIRAVCRRAAGYDASVVAFGPMRLSRHYRSAHWFDLRIDVTGQGFDILDCLCEAAGEAVSHNLLWQRAWAKWRSLPPQQQAIQAGISRLRRDISKVTTAPLIRTVQGVGYRLCVE